MKNTISKIECLLLILVFAGYIVVNNKEEKIGQTYFLMANIINILTVVICLVIIIVNIYRLTKCGNMKKIKAQAIAVSLVSVLFCAGAVYTEIPYFKDLINDSQVIENAHYRLPVSNSDFISEYTDIIVFSDKDMEFCIDKETQDHLNENNPLTDNIYYWKSMDENIRDHKYTIYVEYYPNTGILKSVEIEK